MSLLKLNLDDETDKITTKVSLPNITKEKQAITFKGLIDNYSITPQEIRDHNTIWLIDNFLVKQSLINIFAKGGTGKSFFALYLASYLLKNRKVKQVIYLDGDNGIGIFNRRKIDKFIELNEGLNYISSSKRDINGNYLDKTKALEDLSSELENDTIDLNDTLIIIDSIRDFIKGDMAKDNVVIPYLDYLKRFRDNGATVIFLHHQPKQPNNPDDNNKAYKGATAFSDSVDEAYYLENKSNKMDNEKEIIVTLEPQKCRDETKPQAFILNTNSMSLEQADYYEYALNEKEANTLDYTLEILEQYPNGINQKELNEMLNKIKKDEETEIMGVKARRDFLQRYNNKRLIIEPKKRDGKAEIIYKPINVKPQDFETIDFTG